MNTHKKHWLYSLVNLRWPLLCMLVFGWLAFTAGIRPLQLPDEGRYVGVAWEMIKSGQFSVPLMDGMPFFHKPPLFYWLTALGLETFGFNVWSARLASIVGASAAAIGLYWFVRRYVNGMTATLALLVLLTQPFFFAGAQFANLDMLVAAMISLCIMFAAGAVISAESGEGYRGKLLLAYSFAALGMLAKGLIGFVLPGGVLLLWLLVTRRWKGIRTLLWLPGITLFLLLGLPWLVLMQQRYPGFFDYFFVYQQFQRFLQAKFNNQQPFWFYIPVLLALMLPWSAWLWQARHGKTPTVNQRQRDIELLMLCWLGVILVFFSLPSSKLIGYIMPVLPALAYLIAAPFARRLEVNDASRVLQRFGWTMMLAAAGCVAAIIGVASQHGNSTSQLASKVGKAFAANDKVALLNDYQYDLPFYLKLEQPVWVVSRWQDPSIPQHDNWRKELYDASLFDKAAGKRTLLTSSQFVDRLCRPAIPGTLWVWGEEADRKRYAILFDLATYATDGEQRVWRLTPEIRSAFCETPNNDLTQK